jgi:hypothetical protein
VAEEKAKVILKKLAPEAHINLGPRQPVISGSGIWSDEGRIGGLKEDAPLCCMYTFSEADYGIPWIERALTLYLWKKLYPKRVKNRPLRQEWENLK